jgi:hypothetical protein
MGTGRQYMLLGSLILIAALLLFMGGTYLTYKYTSPNIDLRHDADQKNLSVMVETNQEMIVHNRQILDENKKLLERINCKLEAIEQRLGKSATHNEH